MNEFEVDGICYKVTSDDTVEVIDKGYKQTYIYVSAYRDNYGGDISIPSIVVYNDKNYDVTSINKYAFCKCPGLTSIIIPNSVTSIGEWAFEGCYRLASIVIPSSVTNIGERAFSSCSGLKSIKVESGNKCYDSRNNCNAIINSSTNELIVGCMNTIIPNSVKSIGNHSFLDCSGLSNIVIPESVTSIGDSAFSDCSELKDILISDSVTNIGNWAFCGCSWLRNFIIPESATNIGEGAFAGCHGLKRIYIPKNVSYIGEQVFKECISLTIINVIPDNKYYDSRNNCNAIINSKTNELIAGCASTIIPNSVTSIGSRAFLRCLRLKSIVIPDSVTSIGDWAFCCCPEIRSINLPESVTNIGDGTFANCSRITRIVIPNSVKNIGNYVFENCYRLTNIVVLYNATSIGEGAFKDCSSLSKIVIPESVTSIGNRAFMGCSGLTSIIIPNSVTSIGKEAFWGCSELVNFVIPKNVTYIGDYTFMGCSKLTSIVIPDSVTSIGNEVFSGCSELKDIYNYSYIPQRIADEKFNLSAVIHVPTGYYDAYKNNEILRWHLIIDDINVIESIYLDQKRYSCGKKCAITPEVIIVPEQDAKELKQEWSVSDNSIAFIDRKTGLFVGLGTGKVDISVKVTTNNGEEFTATAEVVVGDICEVPEISFHNGKITCHCDTIGATCHYTYRYINVENGAGDNNGNVIPKIEITAYATAEGYNDSESVRKTFNIFQSYSTNNIEIASIQQDVDTLPF